MSRDNPLGHERFKDMFTVDALHQLKILNEKPAFNRDHEKIELRELVFHELQQAARRLSEELDPSRTYASTGNVVFLEQGGDLPVTEEDVTLWPLDILQEEQQRFTQFYLDQYGRLFGQHVVSDTTKNRDYFFIPQELKPHTIDPFDAIAVQQSLQAYLHILEQTGLQPGHNID